jgi:hypothetical protein
MTRLLRRLRDWLRPPVREGWGGVLRPERDIDALLKRAFAHVAAMTPEERAAMYQAQRESWVRGEMGIGNDADEARARAMYRLPDCEDER